MSEPTGKRADGDRVLDLEHAGRLAEARDLLAELADRAAEDGAARAGLLARASEMALYAEGPEGAAGLARQALEVAEAAGEPVALAHALIAQARVHLRRHTDSATGDAEAALDRIADARALPRSLRALEGNLRGLIAGRRGRVREALDRFARAYQVADGYPELRARVLLSWAVQLRNWGLFDEAQRRAERSLEIRIELGDHYGAAMCYGVLAFIYQRQGLHTRERDALVADLRECERIGGTADVPALHGRLAGALFALGKYAGAWAEAETAIALESERLGIAQGAADADSGSRVHGYGWREQARVALVQGRIDEGLELATRAARVFDRVGDGYGGALCRLTEAELAVASAEQGDPDAAERARGALEAARPVLVRLGAVPEAVESILIETDLDGGAGAAQRIVRQVLPMLQQAGLGQTDLYRRAAETASRLDGEAALDRVVTQAAMLRSLASVVVETDPQPATVVGVRAGAEDEALAFARAAVDGGGLVWWPDSHAAVAVFLGDRHAERAGALAAALGDPGVARETGEVDLEHMWPAGVRARGDAVDRVVATLMKNPG